MRRRFARLKPGGLKRIAIVKTAVGKGHRRSVPVPFPESCKAIGSNVRATYGFCQGKILSQSCFMLTTVQPRCGASSRPRSSLPKGDLRS